MLLNANPFIITPPNEVIQSSNTVTLLIEGPQSLDAGISMSACFFTGLSLQRIIVLIKFLVG